MIGLSLVVSELDMVRSIYAELRRVTRRVATVCCQNKALALATDLKQTPKKSPFAILPCERLSSLVRLLMLESILGCR